MKLFMFPFLIGKVLTLSEDGKEYSGNGVSIPYR